MSKTYNYKNLSFPVADDTKVKLELKYISDGNSSHTVINKPGDFDPELSGPGSVLIDEGKNLRTETTYIVTVLHNLAPQEDTIKIQYKINGVELLVHTNLKTETDNPIIILHVNFPKI